MSIGKQSAPDPPDYSAIATANADSAKLYNQLGHDQLDFYKEQYNTYLPYVTDYLATTNETGDENRTRATDYYDFYKSEYKPLEEDFAQKALDYNNPDRAEARAGAAMADVRDQYRSQRNNSLATLESYGIDPSQTRWGALDLSSRVAEAAATAAAGTKSRLGSEAVGLGLVGEAIKTGRGYAPDISGAYKTATDAGSSGISSANNLYGTSSQAMGTPNSYFASSNAAYDNWSGALDMGYGNQLDATALNNRNVSNTWGTIGSLAGTAIGGFGIGKKYGAF